MSQVGVPSGVVKSQSTTEQARGRGAMLSTLWIGCLGHVCRDIIENINDFIRDVPLNLHRNKLCYLKYGNYESDRCPSPSKLVEL